MEKKKNLVHHYPLPVFFLLSYLLSWWTVPIADGALFPYGPALAAVVVLAFSQGRAGLRQWWARMTRWRAGWWYLIGPALMVASLLGAYFLNMLFVGAGTRFPALPAQAVWIELLLLGGLWEEPGWTGYALPKLQDRFSQQKNGPLIAALILALFRAVWHLPLLVRGTLPWFDVFGYIIVFQLIIAWLYNRSGGSVPAVMVFHYASNLLAGGMMLRAFSGDEKLIYWMLFTICTGLIGLIILWKEGASLGNRAHQEIKAVHPAFSGEK